MNEYLQARYGNPCRGCGYEWSSGDDTCRQIVNEAPARFATLLSGRDGSERHPNLEWSASAYVAHTADNTRIWAERVAAVALGASSPVASYDEDALGRARGYQHLALQGCLWSLGRAVDDWQSAEALAGAHDVVLDHPEQGSLGLREVRGIVAHEVHHHAADVARIVSG